MNTTPEAPQPTVCLTQRQLAVRWAISIRTLERWRVDAQGPQWLRIGNSIRYRLRDVMAYEAEHIRGT